MGKNLLPLIILLFSCSIGEKKPSELILSKKDFSVILKQIHLIESDYELTRSMNQDAKQQLTFRYDSIFKATNIDELIFEKTLVHYSNRPEELEEIYTTVLDEINKEKFSLP